MLSVHSMLGLIVCMCLFFAFDYGVYNIAFSFLSTAHSAMTSPRAKYAVHALCIVIAMMERSSKAEYLRFFMNSNTNHRMREICFTKPRQPHTMRTSQLYEKKQLDRWHTAIHTNTRHKLKQSNIYIKIHHEVSRSRRRTEKQKNAGLITW